MYEKTHELLSQVRRAPAMYLGGPYPNAPNRQMMHLSVVLIGFDLGLSASGESETSFVSAYGSYLRSRFGWCMSCGPLQALSTNAKSPEEAWVRLWATLEEFREHNAGKSDSHDQP